MKKKFENKIAHLSTFRRSKFWPPPIYEFRFSFYKELFIKKSKNKSEHLSPRKLTICTYCIVIHSNKVTVMTRACINAITIIGPDTIDSDAIELITLRREKRPRGLVGKRRGDATPVSRERDSWESWDKNI